MLVRVEIFHIENTIRKYEVRNICLLSLVCASEVSADAHISRNDIILQDFRHGSRTPPVLRNVDASHNSIHPVDVRSFLKRLLLLLLLLLDTAAILRKNRTSTVKAGTISTKTLTYTRTHAPPSPHSGGKRSRTTGQPTQERAGEHALIDRANDNAREVNK